MFESAELGHTIEKDVYERELPRLREALLEAQYQLLDSAKFSLLILVNGLSIPLSLYSVKCPRSLAGLVWETRPSCRTWEPGLVEDSPPTSIGRPHETPHPPAKTTAPFATCWGKTLCQMKSTSAFAFRSDPPA